MKKKILISLGFVVLVVLICISYVWYVYASARNKFIKSDYRIVYTFEELPQNVHTAFLDSIRVKPYFGTTKEDWERTLSKSKKSNEEIQAYLHRLQAHTDAMSTIANPGERINLSDVIEEPLPNKQLIFAGISKDSCFLYYIQGGFAVNKQLLVYKFNKRSAKILFRATLWWDTPDTLTELKQAVIQKGIEPNFHLF